jgi:peptidylprolyl isomerase
MGLHYKGTIRADGKKFDSSYDRNSPLEFNYLVQKMIPGFEEGIGMLGKGGKATLIIPYFQAYGKAGRPGVIPPYSDLVFDIEIVKLAPPNNATYPDGQQHDEHDGHKH